MSARANRWMTVVSIVVVAAVFWAAIGWPLLSIQLRLRRNTAIANRIVESLHERFPGAKFRGNVSYENEVVYITAITGLEPKQRTDVELWLIRMKSDQRIAPEIWLRFGDSAWEPENTIKIGLGEPSPSLEFNPSHVSTAQSPNHRP